MYVKFILIFTQLGVLNLDVSEDKLELVRKIKEYRGCKELVENLQMENELLKEDNEDYKDHLADLQSIIIDRSDLLDDINDLINENNKLKSDLEDCNNYYDFIITSPNEVKSVYGEIRSCLAAAEREVLVCSPWITYLTTEFNKFNKKVDIKIITKWQDEDIKSGITDKDKLRVLHDNIGADLRFNNNLHAKLIIVDSSVAIISSANLTRNGLHVNYEAGVVIRKNQDVLKAAEFFNDLWIRSKPLTMDMVNK
jgi:phosphatidylserine/phosphatidylglycerophosphate/cardiolipin synthase-like enzyme